MRVWTRLVAIIATSAVLAAACGGANTPQASGSAAAKYPTKTVDIMAPAATGGGFDTTARLVQRALTEEKLVTTNVTVSNVPGAGGSGLGCGRGGYGSDTHSRRAAPEWHDPDIGREERDPAADDRQPADRRNLDP